MDQKTAVRDGDDDGGKQAEQQAEQQADDDEEGEKEEQDEGEGKQGDGADPYRVDLRDPQRVRVNPNIMRYLGMIEQKTDTILHDFLQVSAGAKATCSAIFYAWAALVLHDLSQPA